MTSMFPYVPWTFEMVFHVKETLREYTKRMAADQSVAVSWPCHLSCFESALGGVLGCAGSLKWNAFKGILWWQLLQGLTFIFPPERTEGITWLYRLYRLNATKHTLVCCTAPVSSLHFGAVACKTFPWRRLHWSGVLWFFHHGENTLLVHKLACQECCILSFLKSRLELVEWTMPWRAFLFVLPLAAMRLVQEDPFPTSCT